MSNMIQINLNKGVGLTITIMIIFVANFNLCLSWKCIILFWNGINILFKKNWTTFSKKKVDFIIKTVFLSITYSTSRCKEPCTEIESF